MSINISCVYFCLSIHIYLCEAEAVSILVIKESSIAELTEQVRRAGTFIYIDNYLYLSIYRSAYLSILLSICLSIYIYLSVYPYPSIWLSIFDLYLSISMYPSIYIYICIYVYMSISLYIHVYMYVNI